MNNNISDAATALESYLASELKHSDAKKALQPLVDQQLHQLNILFALPDRGADQLVIGFIHQYIICTPKYLSAFHELGEMTGITEYTEPFLKSANQLFFDKHPIIDALSGEHALLCKAYLFHRMLEELNDRVMLERQLPLTPIDIAHTNLIAHTLIGDEQANLLDQTVLIQLELISASLAEHTKDIFQQASENPTAAILKSKGWQDVYARWPFLKEDIADIFNR